VPVPGRAFLRAEDREAEVRPEHFSKHFLSFCQQRKDTLEFSELAQSIDSKSMQQDDGWPFTLVMKSDLNSVVGRESVHIMPPHTGRPRRLCCMQLVGGSVYRFIVCSTGPTGVERNPLRAGLVSRA
jgi:hypothetical protein